MAQETDPTANHACNFWLSKTLAAELIPLDRKLLRASAAPGYAACRPAPLAIPQAGEGKFRKIVFLKKRILCYNGFSVYQT